MRFHSTGIMKNTYLLEVVKAFKPEELEGVRHFMENPATPISQRKEQILLLNAILACGPAYHDHDLEKQAMFPRVYPDKTFVEGKLEKLMVELNKTLRNYAVLQRMMSEQNQDQQQIEWMAWLRERGLENRFQQAVGKYENELMAHRKESVDFHFALLNLRKQEYLWENANNKLNNDLKIGQLLKQLDLYYLTQKAELTNQLLLQRKATKINLADQALFDIQNYGTSSIESPFFEIALQIHRLLLSDSAQVADFRQLMTSIPKNEDQIDPNSVGTFFIYLRSYCTLLIDEGHTELVPVLLELYKSDLEKGRVLDQGKIHPNTYLNIVQIALRANESNWALQFTEQFKHNIIGDQETNFFYKFNYASCLLAKGDLEKAIEAVPFDHNSIFFQLMARRLELKVYYEQKSDLLSYKIDSFRKFVERTAPKTVAPNILTMNMNFAHLLTQLSQSPLKNAKRSAQLVARILGKQWIGERSWLLEKARELE